MVVVVVVRPRCLRLGQRPCQDSGSDQGRALLGPCWRLTAALGVCRA